MVCQVINCPTNPEVPMPAPAGLFFILKTRLARGPKIALATIGGIHIIGFFIIFEICNIEVPIPCANSPFQPLTLKLITAKPII